MAIGNMHNNACVAPETCSETDRQRRIDRHTDRRDHHNTSPLLSRAK